MGKIEELLKDKYKLRIPPTVYYDLLADVVEIEEQESKTGHWIIEGEVGNGNRYCHCSECGHGDEQAITQVVPYCWWCGAKMVEPQESEDKE